MFKKAAAKTLLLMFAAAVALPFAPAAHATPINYDFTVHIISGPLRSTDANGSFSYDSSSIRPGGTNSALGLLTTLDFTFDGITYTAATANTGYLSFDAAGDLSNILFGTNCVAGDCTLVRGKSWVSRSGTFTYISSPTGRPGTGQLKFSLVAGPVAVPEPGTLGMFGLGALLLGLFVGTRRRLG